MACLLMVIATVLALVALSAKTSIDAFNLSPLPNLVIKDPQLSTLMPKMRSSYFGYTMSLRPRGIIVGAPRAQSTLEEQSKVNETGGIYKCSLVNAACTPFMFNRHGNRQIDLHERLLSSEKLDNQWLGAAMDGGTWDTDKLLVCAPRFIAPSAGNYHLHGVCYWIANTLGENPVDVHKISPFQDRNDQMKEDKRNYNFMIGEMGLSAHISDDNEEILMGAPGIDVSKGSVVIHHKKTGSDSPIANRRDTTSQKHRRTRQENSSGSPARVTYESDVLRPELWGQPDDSYFGYAVGSGRFDSTNPNKLLYVATAPQANEQSGEAYIFDIRGKSIVKHFVFRGSQFGEYFGYSVLAEDLNGDGLTDVIVSAPQYAHEDSHDNGAIYVFINRGNFNFDQILLKSPLTDSARFGTTLSRLGDINHDGFNDIAVGAPFAGNGTVFVYLGNEKGIREQHSQRLSSPTSVESKYGVHMFGHGLSKGSDIDGNGFNDFAVGAPNAEALFVYRAYPVVKVVATVKSQTREINPDQTKVKLTPCYGIETDSEILKQVDLAIRLVIDSKVNRVNFTQTQTNMLSFNATADISQQCREFECDVQYSVADIFKPIELVMHYDVINKIPNSEVFCETCAAVDPADPKVYTEKIIFNTGCASICVADLKLTSSGFSSDFILGSSNTLKINYEVTNSGETAYLPQINITSSNRMNFAKIPSNCKVTNDVVMVCDLNRGQPIENGGKASITVIFDSSSITGQSMAISARVFSAGEEQNANDNFQHDHIALKEFTDIEIIGSQSNGKIDLENFKNTTEVINHYVIKSYGPSTVGAMEVAFQIPYAYNASGINISIIDLYNITMLTELNGQSVEVELLDRSNTLLLTDTVEKSIASSYQNAHKTNSKSNRKHKLLTATNNDYLRISRARPHKDLKGKLPRNQTVIFSCSDQDELVKCVRAVMRVYNLKPDQSLSVRMHYNIDLNEVNEVLRAPLEFFVLVTNVTVTRIAATASQSLNVISRIEPDIISKHQIYSVPIWIIVLAIIVGVLLLSAIVYALHKHGFFKRAKKEEMKRLSQRGHLTSNESLLYESETSEPLQSEEELISDA